MNRSESVLRASTYGRGLWEVDLAPSSGVLPPNLLSSYASEDVVELEWQSPFYVQNLVDYSIYRNGERVARKNGTSYLDRDVVNETTYEYYVTANYATGQESSASNITMATPIGDIELPYSQNFETGTAGWKAKYNFEGWEHGVSDELGIQGNEGSFFGINSGLAGGGIHVTDYLFTPEIDLSGFTGRTITLKFDYALRNYRTYDKLFAVYRTSPDDEWVNIERLRNTSSNSWKWEEYEIDLPEEAMVEGVQIGFYYDDSNEHAWGAAVDNVSLFHNTTSVNLLSDEYDILIYPNPSKGLFDLSVQGLPQPGFKISIYDINGKLVLDRKINNISFNHNETIDLTKEGKGIYQIVIRSGKAEYKTKITIH